MKTITLSLLTLSLSTPAFAVSPCRTETMKEVTCSAENAGTKDSITIRVSRYLVRDNGSGRCQAAGTIQESSSAQLVAGADSSFVDLFFDANKNRQPLSDLEAGRELEFGFEKAGFQTDLREANAKIRLNDSQASGTVSIQADVINLFRKPGLELLSVHGPLLCSTGH